jgi:FkbM family methyltransferase
VKELLCFENRWQLLVNRLLFRRSRVLVYRTRGLDILIDHSAGDANGTRACLASPMYRHYLGLMKFQQPIRVLDVGAQGGGFPLMLLSAGLRLSKVACVEMNPRTFTRLQFNIGRNVPGQYKLMNVAVSGSRAPLNVQLGNGSTSDSIYGSNADKSARHQHLIQGVTLDDVITEGFEEEELIELCKIDIEGAEYDVFGNPGHSLIRKIHYLIIELHTHPHKVQLLSHFKHLGFAEVADGGRGESQVHCFVNCNQRP